MGMLAGLSRRLRGQTMETWQKATRRDRAVTCRVCLLGGSEHADPVRWILRRSDGGVADARCAEHREVCD